MAKLTVTGKTSNVTAMLQAMAVKIVQTILKVGTEIREPAQVDMLLDFIAPLVADVHIDGDDDDEEVIPCFVPVHSTPGTPHISQAHEPVLHLADCKHILCRTLRMSRAWWPG